MNPLQIAGGILGTALAVAIAGGAWHCWTVTKEYAEFREGVAKAGKEAKAKAEKKEADDRKAKEKADAETKRLTADNAALARKLRDARSRSGFVPPASPLATSPNRACFDRGALEQGLQRLDDEISSVIGQCDAARIALDAAKAWGQEVVRNAP